MLITAAILLSLIGPLPTVAGPVVAAPDAFPLELDIALEYPTCTADSVDGPIAHLVVAIMLTAAGSAILRSGRLPAWAGRTAFVVAAVNLLFVPTMVFGDDPERFYRAAGWDTAAVAEGLLVSWVLAVGIAWSVRVGAGPRSGRGGAAPTTPRRSG